MSFQAMAWAVEQELKTTEKMVLVMLANRCNHDTGRCDPSHKRLAKECGMSVSTLKRCIERLAEQGMLTIERREQDGVSLPNQYHLKLGVSSQGTYPAAIEPKVSPDLRGGVGSQGANGWGHSELQTCNINLEDKPVSKPLTDADKSAPAAGDNHVALPAVLSEQQQPSYERIRDTFWERFDKAYSAKYDGAVIPRNAKVNSQVKQLIQRLGKEAPAVAYFYVTQVNEQRVTMSQHSLEFLIKNAEGYRTQWFTGRSMTAGRARQIDSTQTNLNVADEAIQLLRARRAKEGGS